MTNKNHYPGAIGARTLCGLKTGVVTPYKNIVTCKKCISIMNERNMLAKGWFE